VNTNNREITVNCLESLYATSDGLLLETIVVNNACTDESTAAIHERFPQVKIIENQEMLGFSTNNNLALAQATGRYFMLLNDDTIILPGTFQMMLDYMNNNQEVGVVGANLFYPDGSPQKCYDHAPNPLYDGLQPLSEMLYPLPQANGRPLEVANVCGACMMVRADVALEVGGLDPQFDPLYSEEVDWCHRIQKAGWKIIHLPDAKIIHLAGITMNRNPVRRYERIFEKKTLFFRKHYGSGTVFLYKSLLFTSNFIKSLAWAVFYMTGKKGAKIEFQTHWNMVRKSLHF
jgi:GT2 family glycosyltransferase